ncbi:Ig-like domain repeat protein [Fimbriiglobus ruber]|uniref:Carboxylesterase n=1 Tax=Fimbriiglobus ruber TaxID=1908690 RepID=A0A225DR91_9BACT|nr:Ig-like domain repeat protein [Fimbriiglobus ruber]OWK44010.1 Carboxylesterase precursor [Fimbriiglobus ruber]
MWVTGTGGYQFFAQGTGDTYTSPAGNFGTLVYVPDEGYEYTAKDQTVSDFDAKGDLTLVTDRDGLTTQYAYNGDDSLASVTAADGGVTTFAYGGGGLAQITEPGGRVWTFTADGDGDLTGWTTPDGTSRTFEYDNDHHLTMDTWGAIQTAVTYANNVVTAVVRGGQTWTVDSVAGQGFADPVGTTAAPAARVTDPLGYQTQYQVTSGDVPLAVTRPDGLTQTWKLLDGVLVTSATDFLGQTTTTQYGSVSGVLDGDVTGVTNPDGSHQSYGYDPLYHQITSSTDGNGNPTTYGLNATGDRTSTTDPLNDTTTDVWADGLLMSETDAVGDVTSYTYTQYRQTSTVTHTGPTGIVSSTATYTYDAAGNLSTMTDGVGDVTTYVYDGENRLVSTTDPDHNTTSTTYTPDGQVAGTTDANGIVTTYAYNTQGLVTQVVGNADGATAADRRTTLTAYDADGDPTAVTDPLGNVTRTYYDVDGRAVAVTDPNGYTSNTLYDADGNPTETVDNVGNTTLTAFDAMSRPISTAVYSSAATGSTLVTSNQTVYDADGNATLQTDGDGNQTQTRYDAANRLTYEADAAGTAAAVRTTTSYDPAGRATLVVDGTGDSTLTAYDAEGRSLGQTIVSAAGTVVTESTTRYDLAGRPTASIDPDGTTHLTGYDPAGRVTLSSAVDENGDVISSTTTAYDPAGNPTATIDGDGHTTLTAYDAFGAATRVQSPAAGDGAATSAYDLDGRLTLATDADGNETYDVYDADGNLLSEEVDDAEGDVDTYSRKAYDPDGNLIGLIDGDSHVTSYAYDALGRQTTSDAGVDGPAGTDAKTTDAYDGAGNLTEVVDADGNVTQSAFDADNRLTAETLYDDEGDVVRQRTYAYDADGRQTLITDGVGNTTLSTYDAAGQLLTQTVRGPNTGGGTSHPDAREAAPAAVTMAPAVRQMTPASGGSSVYIQGSTLVVQGPSTTSNTIAVTPDGAGTVTVAFNGTALGNYAVPSGGVEVLGGGASNTAQLTPAAGLNYTFVAGDPTDVVTVNAPATAGGSGAVFTTTAASGGTTVTTTQRSDGTALGSVLVSSAAAVGYINLVGGSGADVFSVTPQAIPFNVIANAADALTVNAPTSAATSGVYYDASGTVNGGTVIRAYQEAAGYTEGASVGTVWFSDATPLGEVNLVGTTATDTFVIAPQATPFNVATGGGTADNLTLETPGATTGVYYDATGTVNSGTVIHAYNEAAGNTEGASLGTVWFPAAAAPGSVNIVGTSSADTFAIAPQATPFNIYGGATDALMVDPPAAVTAGVYYDATATVGGGTVVSAYNEAAGYTEGSYLGGVWFYNATPLAMVNLNGTAAADSFVVTPQATPFNIAIGGGSDALTVDAPASASTTGVDYDATGTVNSGTVIHASQNSSGKPSIGTVWYPNAGAPAQVTLNGTPTADEFDVIPQTSPLFKVYGDGGSGDLLNDHTPAAAGTSGVSYSTTASGGGTYVYTYRSSDNADLGDLWYASESPPTSFAGVAVDPTTTSLARSSSSTTYGQAVTLTATVGSSAGTPSGSATFLDGATVLGTGTLSSGVAMFTTAALTGGSHAITAVYAGNATYTTSTSAAVSVTVSQVASTTYLSVSVNPAVAGQSVTLTATVAPGGTGSGMPTGTVTFKDGSTTLGTGTLSGGVVTFTTSALAVGSHSITAVYSDDTNFTASTSAAVTETVNPANTTTTLAASTNTATYGQAVTLTATVAAVAPGAGMPTGTVTFKDGSTTLGTGTLSGGVATFTTSALAVGSHSITATYGTVTSFTGSTSGSLAETVNPAATTTGLAASANAAVYGQGVTLIAAVAAVAPGGGTPTGTVTFYDGSINLGTMTLSGGSTTLITTVTGLGSHTFTATYNPGTGYNASGATFQVEVGQASSTVSLSLSSNYLPAGSSVTATATVGVALPGGGSPTGTVTFMDGTTTLGTATVTRGLATFLINTLTVGNHTITASYSGDTNFRASTSAGQAETATRATANIIMSSSDYSAVYGQAVTYTATVQPNPSGGVIPTGSITFTDDSGTLGTVTLVNGVATIPAPFLEVGTDSISASYSGDTNFAGRTSPGFVEEVTEASSTVSVTASPSPATFGQTVTLTATVVAQAPGSGTPTGSVEFDDGPTDIGTGTIDGDGVASLTVQGLAPGTHSIVALYYGDDNFFGNYSSPWSEGVGKAVTVVGLSWPTGNVVSGQSVALTATVVAPGGGGRRPGRSRSTTGRSTSGRAPWTSTEWQPCFQSPLRPGRTR